MTVTIIVLLTINNIFWFLMTKRAEKHSDYWFERWQAECELRIKEKYGPG